MAEPAAGADLRDRVSGCAVREDAARRAGGESSRVCGDRDQIWKARKDVLGLWTSSNEGAKFWLSVLTELKNRGVKDILIACVDGLKGFPQAIESDIPAGAGAALHRAHGASQPELRELEGTQESGGGSEADLPGGDGGASGAGTETSSRASGRSIRRSADCGGSNGSG